jgi:hypothetical protein
MATSTPSTDGEADLRLADADPEVTRSGSGDPFMVKFTMEGIDLLELQNVLRPRLAAVGVERISRLGMTMGSTVSRRFAGARCSTKLRPLSRTSTGCDKTRATTEGRR